MQDKQNSNLTRDMANDSRIFDICEIIGEQFGLHIDQVGELDSEIRGIFLGINKSEDFINHIISRLEIDKDLAQKIANEVSAKIYVVLQEKIQSSILPSTEEIKPTKPSHIADLEKAGGFTIEHETSSREGGIGSEDLRAMPTRDKWSPLGQTIVPVPNNPWAYVSKGADINQHKEVADKTTTPTTPTPAPNPEIEKPVEPKKEIFKEVIAPNVPTPAPEITKPVQINKELVREAIVQNTPTPIVPATKEIAKPIETKAEEPTVSTVPDNLPIEPVGDSKPRYEIPNVETTTIGPNFQKTALARAEPPIETKIEEVLQTKVPEDLQTKPTTETTINLRRIKTSTPENINTNDAQNESATPIKIDKPHVEQGTTPSIPEPINYQTPLKPVPEPKIERIETEPLPEPPIPEKIKLNPDMSRPIPPQKPRSFDPYREPVN